jgi:hypothetical protein
LCGGNCWKPIVGAMWTIEGRIPERVLERELIDER